MKDFMGTQLSVGDKVVFVKGANNSSALEIGNIKKIYDNDRVCTVDCHSHVKSYRIMKLGEQDE